MIILGETEKKKQYEKKKKNLVRRKGLHGLKLLVHLSNVCVWVCVRHVSPHTSLTSPVFHPAVKRSNLPAFEVKNT